MLDINKIANLPQSTREEIKKIKLLETLKEECNQEYRNRKIVISFLFFDRTNPLFNLGEINEGWYLVFLDAINELSTISRTQLFSGEKKERYEPHNYIKTIDKLNYKSSILTDPQREACQLRLTKSTGRIHGFFIDNIYYIVFLDHKHNMYDCEGYEKARALEPPKTDYEILEHEFNDLIDKLKKSEQEYFKIDKFVCDNCFDCHKVEQIINITGKS